MAVWIGLAQTSIVWGSVTLLVMAGWVKQRDRGRFRAVLSAQGFRGRRRQAISLLLAPTELALGITTASNVGLGYAFGQIVTVVQGGVMTVLGALFLAVSERLRRRLPGTACGCFGVDEMPNGFAAIRSSLIVLAGAVLLSAPPEVDHWSTRRALAVATGVTSALLLVSAPRAGRRNLPS